MVKRKKEVVNKLDPVSNMIDQNLFTDWSIGVMWSVVKHNRFKLTSWSSNSQSDHNKEKLLSNEITKWVFLFFIKETNILNAEIHVLQVVSVTLFVTYKY